MTDDDQLRKLAHTRPGYATYPDSAPGTPSWWLRHGHPHPTRTLRPDDCLIVAREGAGLMCARPNHEHSPAARPAPPTPTGFITLVEPPARRRWWHRITRRR
ncbi:hypothetical protein ABZ847_29460 [Streptomyces bauhiniae]